MNHNVILTISGLHSTGDEDNGLVETVVDAEYYNRNGTHYLLYEEKEEGDGQVSKNRIKCKGNRLELIRQGILNTHMVFEEGKTHMTPYQTPYGQMVLGIVTRSVKLMEREKEIRIEVDYQLEADGQYLSDSRIVIGMKEQ